MLNGNKHYPSSIKDEVEEALSFYPDLKDTPIQFRWGVFTQRSFMLAQPKVPTLLRNKNKREYQIIMRKSFFLKNRQFPNGKIPFNVIVGWLGHELGHICDYKDRSSWNLAWFGLFYYLSNSFIKKAEIAADKFTIEHGLLNQLVESKEFGRNPAYFPKKYIVKLNKLYPSVADVKQWAKELA